MGIYDNYLWEIQESTKSPALNDTKSTITNHYK